MLAAPEDITCGAWEQTTDPELREKMQRCIHRASCSDHILVEQLFEAIRELECRNPFKITDTRKSDYLEVKCRVYPDRNHVVQVDAFSGAFSGKAYETYVDDKRHHYCLY